MTSDGQIHRSDEDKSRNVDLITDGYSGTYPGKHIDNGNTEWRKAAIIDAMAVV